MRIIFGFVVLVITLSACSGQDEGESSSKIMEAGSSSIVANLLIAHGKGLAMVEARLRHVPVSLAGQWEYLKLAQQPVSQGPMRLRR